MRLPVSRGNCRYCRREMWSNREGTRLLAVSDRVPGACDTCASWTQRHPGRDPREARNNVAEQVPAERGEAKPGWRHDPGRRCALVPLPPSAFEPDPDPDDEVPDGYLVEQQQARERAARGLCSACPVREACRTAALCHGYEGLWGGLVFAGEVWTDVVTGEQGPTVYARPATRRKFEALREAVPA